VRRGEKNPAGTPGFTAPEVFGHGSEAPSTDVYSLGALAYMLLTLEAPFGDASPVEILNLQTTQRPRPLTDIRHDLPPDVDTVVLASLDPDPSRRPQSARELARALSDALARPATPPRQTVEILVERHQVRRPVTAHNASFRRDSAKPAVPSTRGVLFRSAYEVLGARRGSAWVAEVSHRLPELGLALSPQSSSLAWYPTTDFISVLKSLGNDERERRTIAWQLGRTAVDLSFGQFYGADATASSPAEVLCAADLFWRCYHSWGTASVTATGTDAEVTVIDGVAADILCVSIAGLLAGVVAHTGGLSVGVEHRTCVANGADRCAFSVTWRLATDQGIAPTVRGGPS